MHELHHSEPPHVVRRPFDPQCAVLEEAVLSFVNTLPEASSLPRRITIEFQLSLCLLHKLVPMKSPQGHQQDRLSNEAVWRSQPFNAPLLVGDHRILPSG